GGGRGGRGGGGEGGGGGGGGGGVPGDGDRVARGHAVAQEQARHRARGQDAGPVVVDEERVHVVGAGGVDVAARDDAEQPRRRHRGEDVLFGKERHERRLRRDVDAGGGDLARAPRRLVAPEAGRVEERA